MIAIIGGIDSGARASASGTTVAQVGRAAVDAGAAVEVVGVVAVGTQGDRLLGELARERLGHAAVLRSAADSLEAADLALALRYLPDLRVLVLLGVAAALLPAAVEGAAFAGARVVVVTGDEAVPAGLPDDAIVLQAPVGDGAGSTGGFVGHLAARLDAGAALADAWAETVALLAVESSGGWLAGASPPPSESEERLTSEVAEPR
ncbi:MAG TPA: hypothetical protein VEX41_01595 [Candidatus Eisenbacteria bacterium]|nr:hypothetical protein [Candidatus Eisenbacteria bacterium]